MKIPNALTKDQINSMKAIGGISIIRTDDGPLALAYGNTILYKVKGTRASWLYDMNGNPVCADTVGGYYFYNEDGKCYQTISGGNLRQFDIKGDIIYSKNRRGEKWFEYDEHRRIVHEKSDKYEIWFEYDDNDRLIRKRQVINGVSDEIIYGTDDNGDYSFHTGTGEKIWYDINGRKYKSQSADGSVNFFTYDDYEDDYYDDYEEED